MVKHKKSPGKHAQRASMAGWRPRLFWLGKWVGLPLLIYFAFFCIFTWPWITHFNGWFFTDAGDGLQNVWNMWWVDKSITDLHQLPWHTIYLHAPWGVSLVGQTMNPFNGFVGIILMHVFGLSLVQAFNIMIIFSFVVGGLTAFWLCYYFSRSYAAGLVGGFIYTFSSYHFAHAVGHMQLVSLEWLPLFILLWWKFLKRPTYLLAFGASFSLLLVLFCDYYYFLYSLIIAGFVAIYLFWQKQIPPLKERTTYLPFAVFLIFSAVMVLPLPVALLILNSNNSLSGAHNPRIFSTDIVTPFLDGGFWHLSSLTHFYWRHVKAFTAESSTYLTVSLLVVFVISWLKRKNLSPSYYFWVIVAIFFGVMSLGPRLHYGGHTLEALPMPYVLMEKIIPGFKLSGMPVRMLFVTILCLAIIASMVLAKLDFAQWKGRLLVGAFILVYAIEVWPSSLPLTSASYPKYVYAIHDLPAGEVLDNAAKSQPEQLLNQTEHEKIMPLGYISRTPKKLESEDLYIIAAYTRGQYANLCKDFKIRYMTMPASEPLHTTFPIIYHDKRAIIYDLKDSPSC
jgi:hypothetical protein